jgi:uncharacterized protein
MDARMSVSPGRISSIDAIRGFAVMGILLMNIVSFGLPGRAYVDPNYYGGASGANWCAWALAYVFADGKLRGLFTLLFGASMVIVAEGANRRDGSAARVHFNRMAVLFLIGLAHAYVVWSGDVLVLYSVCGSVAFLAWRLRATRLLVLGMTLLAVGLLRGLHGYLEASSIVDAASKLEAGAAVLNESVQAATWASSMTVEKYLAGYGGDWSSVMSMRARHTYAMQTEWLPSLVVETLALMFIGMALLKNGFVKGEWESRRYIQVASVGFGIALPLCVPLVWLLERSNFSPVMLGLTKTINLQLLRPLLSIAYAAVIILIIKAGRARWMVRRLQAVGQMALSNYLGTSVVCTTIFYGTGLGFYGRLERWQLYGVVLIVWAVMAWWSLPWLARYRQGPVEWAWRCLARRRWEPIRR